MPVLALELVLPLLRTIRFLPRCAPFLFHFPSIYILPSPLFFVSFFVWPGQVIRLARSVSGIISRMSDMVSNVVISPPSGNFPFDESVADAYPFVYHDRFLNLPWFPRWYWHSPGLVGRYISVGVLLGLVPIRALDFLEWYLRFKIPVRDLFRLQ